MRHNGKCVGAFGLFLLAVCLEIRGKTADIDLSTAGSHRHASESMRGEVTPACGADMRVHDISEYPYSTVVCVTCILLLFGRLNEQRKRGRNSRYGSSGSSSSSSTSAQATARHTHAAAQPPLSTQLFPKKRGKDIIQTKQETKALGITATTIGPPLRSDDERERQSCHGHWWASMRAVQQTRPRGSQACLRGLLLHADHPPS